MMTQSGHWPDFLSHAPPGCKVLGISHWERLRRLQLEVAAGKDATPSRHRWYPLPAIVVAADPPRSTADKEAAMPAHEVPVAMKPVIIPGDTGSSDCAWCDDRRMAIQGAGAHPNAGKATTHVTAAEAATHVTAAEAATHVTAAEAATHVAAAEAATHVAAAEAATHVTTAEAAAHVAAASAAGESNRGHQRDCQDD
jgi:hypothetical protein